jgi:hypothetical protein
LKEALDMIQIANEAVDETFNRLLNEAESVERRLKLYIFKSLMFVNGFRHL